MMIYWHTSNFHLGIFFFDPVVNHMVSHYYGLRQNSSYFMPWCCISIYTDIFLSEFLSMCAYIWLGGQHMNQYCYWFTSIAHQCIMLFENRISQVWVASSITYLYVTHYKTWSCFHKSLFHTATVTQIH